MVLAGWPAGASPRLPNRQTVQEDLNARPQSVTVGPTAVHGAGTEGRREVKLEDQERRAGQRPNRDGAATGWDWLRSSILVAAMPDAVIVIDGEGAIEQINDRTATLFGYQERELLGRPVEVLVPPAQRATRSASSPKVVVRLPYTSAGLSGMSTAQRRTHCVTNMTFYSPNALPAMPAQSLMYGRLCSHLPQIRIRHREWVVVPYRRLRRGYVGHRVLGHCSDGQ